METGKKKVVAIVGFYLPGIYPAGDDAVVSDLLAPALIKATADADPDVAAKYDVRLFNFPTTIDSAEATLRICEVNPVLVAYSVYVWNYAQTMTCSDLVRKFRPDASIVMGGPQVMYRAVEEMQKHPQIDVIVYGNGELRFRQMLREGLSPDLLARMPRVTYRDAAGRIVQTQGDVVDDISEIPSPYQTGVINLNDGRRHTVFIETFRGCPFKCGYCVWGDNNVRIRRFDIEQILKDVEIVYNNPNVEVVYMTDACLLYTRDRARRICDAIASCSRKIPTVMTLDIRMLDEDTFEYLSKVELIRNQFHFGLQSTNPEALALLNRRIPEDVFIARIGLLRRLKPEAEISLDLIYGLPGDNYEGFRKSVDFAFSLNPSKLYLSHLLVLPGTPFWDRRTELGLDHSAEPPYMVRSNRQFTASDMRATMTWVMWIQVMNYFEAIKDAIVRVRDRRAELRYIDLIDRMIAIVKERIDPISELTHGFTLESENANRRHVMNTFSKPENGLILYEAAMQLLKECGVEQALGESIEVGIKYYRSLCQNPGAADTSLLAAKSKKGIKYIQTKWQVSGGRSGASAH